MGEGRRRGWLGIGLFTAEGVSVYGTNTVLEGFDPVRLEMESEISFVIGRLELVARQQQFSHALIDRCLTAMGGQPC